MDCVENKLFVGGLARGTSEEDLSHHFSRYGAVLKAVVLKDKGSGRGRGFGFVQFANDYDSNALTDTHIIRGKTVEVTRAFPKHNLLRNETPSNDMTTTFTNKKIFVGGLASNTTDDEFKTYFEQFGLITDIVVMRDTKTNRPRGFGFVTYDSEDSIKAVGQRNFHELNGKVVEVKPAIPKEGIQSKNGYHNNFQAAPYGPPSYGYAMPVQYTPVASYCQCFQCSHYPYAYPCTSPWCNVPWTNPNVHGFYYLSNVPCYPWI